MQDEKILDRKGNVMEKTGLEVEDSQLVGFGQIEVFPEGKKCKIE